MSNISRKSCIVLFQLELTKWVSAKHNMGMAFSRDLWRKIHGCKDLFCNFDDYNWDWSLEHISNNCITHKAVSARRAGAGAVLASCTGLRI